MAFDAGYLSALEKEFSELLVGARTEKIFQCSRDTFLFQFHAYKEKYSLFLSAGPSGGNLYLTKRVFRHPDTAPMFCMLLRKHLTGARLTSVSQLGFERVLSLSFEAPDALGVRHERKIYLELMGKRSNLILCGEDECIIASLRPLDLSASPDRPLLPGFPYAPPPVREDLIPLLQYGDQEVEALYNSHGNQMASDALLNSIGGIGPLCAREIVYRACGDIQAPLSAIPSATLAREIQTIASLIQEKRFSPTIVFNPNAPEKKPMDYAYYPIHQYESFPQERKASPSEILDLFYGERAALEELHRLKDRCSTLLKTAQKRLGKKLSALQDDLERAKESAQLQKYGDLIMQELYRVKRGDALLRVEDYESGETLGIKLDSRYTPVQNAQNYYKLSRKKKRAKALIEEQLERCVEELSYAQSVFESLERAASAAEVAEISAELSAWEYGHHFAKSVLSGQGKARRETLKSEPELFRSPNGFAVLRGKNNFQNDRLTFSIASKGDFWFHAKGVPGAHVVLHLEGGTEPQNEDFLFAARLALPRGVKDGCEVDYTRVKLVRRHPCALPGRVLYTGEKTLFIKP